MSSFEEPQAFLQNFTGTARLFPLPNLVLFPHVMQPLHIFEPRYRELLAEALTTDRLIVMGRLAPGWEKDYEGRPAVQPIACLSQITTHHKLKNGAFNLLLLGVQRVRLVAELEPRKSFREVHVELCEDVYPDDETLHRKLRQGLRATLLESLPRLPQAQEQIDQLLDGDLPLGILTDIIAYMLDINLDEKQRLLSEFNVHRRCQRLLAHLKRTVERAVVETPFPPTFSSN